MTTGQNARAPLFALLSLLAAWAAAATVAGAFELMRHLPPPGPQLLVAALAVGFSVAVARVGALADAARAVGVRGILAFHLLRFVGFSFLWLHAQGRLPVEFAERAGWGDVVAAAGALALLLTPEGAAFRRGLAVWNVFGALDLLVAVGTAGWVNTVRPGSMVEITRLPLTLVPLFGVPVLLASHVYLWRSARRAPHPLPAPTGA